jgi:uncharacterized protein (TIGR00255 family)
MMSMTGFAALEAPLQADGTVRSWDIRSVNARGLEVRMRLPDGRADLEQTLRAALGKGVSRGTVSLSLKSSGSSGQIRPLVDPAGLEAALEALARVEAAAMDRGLALAPATAADVVAMRGVLEMRVAEETGPVDPAKLLPELDALLVDFNTVRAAEGAELARVIGAQLDTIETLTQAAADLRQVRANHMERVFRTALARLVDAGVDDTKCAQDIAVLAIKADITEEIDRLQAHVTAARGLIAADGPVGRKLDFLTQEFNREANTLCSKAQFAALTTIGLELKTTIDQMREQVQNVE